jgi:hypothetical protein
MKERVEVWRIVKFVCYLPVGIARALLNVGCELFIRVPCEKLVIWGYSTWTFSIYKKLLRWFPTYRPHFLRDLGGFYLLLHKPQSAVRCYEEASILDPLRPDYHMEAGELYARLGQRENAREHYQRALDLVSSESAREIVLRRIAALGPDTAA